MSDLIGVRVGPLPTLRERFSAHPHVSLIDSIVASGGVASWEQSDWSRTIAIGAGEGILELADNNPLVCADRVVLPCAEATLAQIALGPLARGGLLVERPTLLFSFEPDPGKVDAAFVPFGWTHGATVDADPRELDGVLAVTAIAEIETPSNPDDLDDLYEEAFGRSFYVREAGGEWATTQVAGKAHAVYRLRYAPGDERSLLTVQAMADANGKCGAAQVVHAFNVMCGFEESLGVEL